MGTGLMPSNSKAAQRNDVNYVGSFAGAMAQSPSDAGAADMLPGDLETARLFGERVAAVTAKFRAEAMKLYYSWACSLAPHRAAPKIGLPFEAVLASTKTKQLADGTDYLTINPLGYVPFLVLADGRTLHERPGHQPVHR